MVTNEEEHDEHGNKVKRGPKAIQFIKELKVVNSFNFELAYTGSIYLIISGHVSLVIDLISERKPSTIEYAIPLKHRIPKELLQLSKHDIFGFERIG